MIMDQSIQEDNPRNSAKLSMYNSVQMPSQLSKDTDSFWTPFLYRLQLINGHC